MKRLYVDQLPDPVPEPDRLVRISYDLWIRIMDALGEHTMEAWDPPYGPADELERVALEEAVVKAWKAGKKVSS